MSDRIRLLSSKSTQQITPAAAVPLWMRIVFVLLIVLTGMTGSDVIGEATANPENMPPLVETPSEASAVYANVRGFKQAADEIVVYLREREPHFGFFDECHLVKSEPIDMMVPQGYKVVTRLDRTTNGGGLLILSRDDILCDVIDMKDYNMVDESEIVATRQGGITHTLCYTNKSSKAPTLLAALTQYRIDHLGEPLVLYEDFNAHNQDWICSDKTDAGDILAQEFTELFGMSQVVNFETRQSNTLDLVISDVEATAMPSMPFGTSDHKAIQIILCTKETIDEVEKKPSRLMRRSAPWNHAAGYLKRRFARWSAKWFKDVDHAENSWRETCNDAVKKYVKLKAPQRPKACPWWNSKCSRAYKYKRKVFLSHPCSSAKYKNVSRRCSRVQKKAKKVYNQGLKLKLSEMEVSDKAFWELTKEIGGQSRASNKAAPDVNDLVDHFASKMSNAAEIKEDHNSWKPRDSKFFKVTSFKVCIAAVLKSLEALDVNKSINSVANYLLKNCAREIAPSLTSVFKFIVGRGEYPQHWKIGRVTTLHKRKEVSKPKNYRPVTVVPNEDMVFEDVLGDQLYHFLEMFIPKSQYGFLRKCGTQDYGAVVSMKIMDALEKRKEVLIASLDVDGAFDRVWHAGLLKKLRLRGMMGRALLLLKSYLKMRFIEVVRGTVRSRRRKIGSSVPQGGKFPAPLWDFDISTLDELDIDELFGYADDLGLVYIIDSENSDWIIDHINQDFIKLEK